MTTTEQKPADEMPEEIYYREETQDIKGRKFTIYYACPCSQSDGVGHTKYIRADRAIQKPSAGDYCQPRDVKGQQWLILYDDQARKPEYFGNDENAARSRFEIENQSWNCYLMCSALTTQSGPADDRLREAEKVIAILGKVLKSTGRLILSDASKVAAQLNCLIEQATAQIVGYDQALAALRAWDEKTGGEK